MNGFTHEDQRRIWDAEHASPNILLQMDSDQPSSGVVPFYEFLKNISGEKSGIEMCCGKGRNVIWLAQQEGIREAYGIDFSEAAIKEALRRAEKANVSNATFSVVDVTERWPSEDASFDFAIDCFATTDLESQEMRERAVKELVRTLKSGGHVLVYTLTTDDEYHQEVIARAPAEEPGAFYHPRTGKYEKVFTTDEIDTLYGALSLVESKLIEKTVTFDDKKYHATHLWRIYRKV